MGITNSVQINFDKEKTQIIKGVAILTMILHHCIVIPSGTNWVDLVGEAMKVCVSYFTFLVGFGYAFSKNKTLVGGLHRAFKLLVQFWLLLFPIFVPLYVIGGGELTLYQFLTEPFGLDSKWHWFSWYLYFYIYAMLLMPFAAKAIDRFGWKAMAAIIGLSYSIEAGIHFIPNWSDNIFTQALFDCQLNTPLTLLGYYMAKNAVFSKVKLQKKHIVWLLLLFFIAFAGLFIKKEILGFLLYFFYVPALVLAIVGLFSLYKLPFSKKVLVKLGDLSMPMWFIHALFIMPYVTCEWMNSLSLGSPWLKFAIVVLVSYVLAYLFNIITKPLVKRI